MKLEMTGQMRMEQRMKLAPHMIQSMEILQLPILALQERIEQELNSNPILELDDNSSPDEMETPPEVPPEDDADEKALVVDVKNQAQDFERLSNLGDEFKDLIDQSGPYRSHSDDDEKDLKLEAIKNTAAPPQSLHEYLTEQWRLVDAEEPVKKAGQAIIDYIDARGYVGVPLEQLHNKDQTAFTPEHLQEALRLVQELDPPGVGARDIRECLLIQLTQRSEDMNFEYRLVSDHMDALLENRLPEIAKRMDCTIDRLNLAIERLRKLDISPGLQVGRNESIPITPDVIVEAKDSSDDFSVRLADDSLPSLRLSPYYTRMAEDNHVSDNTRKFLLSNIRSAHWIIEAIEQRKNTLLKVARAIVRHQKDFFEQGPLSLRPLPMAKIADEVGVHLATVSRAVSGKYLQCAWGILPLRKFFSGGTEDTSGQAHSWEAIRVKLQQIIDEEDKSRPLNDDQIKEKLAEAGIPNLARRTVAKYRKLMNIPTAKFRKKY
ncbi:MAG TPA: RNA polymerase factor sigma-54 [Sedimentisphaerales bacterium]|jgi:RNA polymerase sigma-54 factor|nr:RNA polymerase factor sigma-54 [Sedimentisphaerales bacterium]HNU30792.1 RNA polymerase factor sigma-54 [Sedimentisphaerales bacterium]